MSLYYTRYSTWKGRQLYLEDIVVTQKMRGKGYGKLLLDHTIAFAKQRGYSGITWQVLDWNQSAIDFYKKYNTKFEEEWINVKVNF
ncbi:MAG TPA: GNAT family N-acetyltransferase, partial [Candidatus Sphingobacterium stercorigallinarum]|nr:GNAT family N-acetyltransferase [Candidatus Sphingobacterium stercorigallinarum]